MRTVAIAALVLTLVTACSSAPGQSRQSEEVPGTVDAPQAQTQTQVGASNLSAPWSMAYHRDSLLISERDSGRILQVEEGGTVREVAVLDGVVAQGEGGLLGIAVHNDHLYAYSTGSGGNRIERYPIEGEPAALTLGTPALILDGIPSASYHSGGRIAFGPDGMLYATTGDAGNPQDAQDLDSLAGKILRLTPDGAIPEDNPFPGSPIYSFGHRNPQGIAWGKDGTLYASEFGQNTWDELNVIEAGLNYGWPEAEGIAGDERFRDPVKQWQPSEASPSGIAVLGHWLYVANLRGERLRRIPLADLDTSEELFTGQFGRLRDVAVAPDGALWVLTNNTDGRGTPSTDDDRLLRIESPDSVH